ncbi:MAG: cytochrome C [Alphaproteobacteria bacterium]|nr:cytochrome C [Alphaproteobacteria bacterium]
MAGVAALAALALAGAVAAGPHEDALAPDYPAHMTQAQSDYVEHCGGCHGIRGIAAPADLPTLKDRVGWFLCLPEGRSYLVRLPNISRSRIDDNAQLADLLNFMLFGLGGRSVPAGARPFTAAEVARERASPFTSVSLVETRRVLVERLVRQCGAPASLRLMYPAQTAAR